MTAPITFNLAAALEAKNRLDDGLFTDEDKPRLMELAALYEGYCQQEWDRLQEETERAERARWLAQQCGGCTDGGTGEQCDEHRPDPADGSPGDLYDPPPPRERLSCGSLRPHETHEWIGQHTEEIYTCHGAPAARINPRRD